MEHFLPPPKILHLNHQWFLLQGHNLRDKLMHVTLPSPSRNSVRKMIFFFKCGKHSAPPQLPARRLNYTWRMVPRRTWGLTRRSPKATSSTASRSPNGHNSPPGGMVHFRLPGHSHSELQSKNPHDRRVRELFYTKKFEIVKCTTNIPAISWKRYQQLPVPSGIDR